MKLTPWKAEATATPEEITSMIRSAIEELVDSEPGDWAMNIDAASGVLVIGVAEPGGKTEIYQCRIDASNVDAEEQIIEGQLSQFPRQKYLA